MDRISKVMFFIEAAIFGTPILLIFAGGLLLLPIQIAVLAKDFEMGALLYILGYLIGVSGVAAFIILCRYIINSEAKMPNRYLTTSLLLPPLALLGYLVYSSIISEYQSERYWAIIYAAPIILAAHGVVLSRKYFFKNRDFKPQVRQ